MKYFIIIIISVLNIFMAGATNQYKDLLVVNNDTFEINSPIDLISDSSFRYVWYNKIINKRFYNTACWRGAICTWVIKNDSLFLIKAESCNDKSQIDLSIIDDKHKMIFAKWINGSIDFSSGRILCSNVFDIDKIYDDSNNDYIFEFDNVINVYNGTIKIEQLDNRISKCGRFKDKGEINLDIENQLNIAIQTTEDVDFSMYSDINKDGKLANIELFGINDSTLTNSILNVLNDIDGFPVYYKKGKLINNRIEGDFKIMKK